MAVSGSTDFLLTRSDIIEAALRKCGVLQTGESPASSLTSNASQALNALTKAWANEGIGLWKNELITLFLSATGTQSYLLPGAYATTSEVVTEVATAQTSGNSTLVLDSITGMADTDVIGIELDDGTMQWTTINGTPAALTVTLTDALTDDVAVDNDVYSYATADSITRPIELIEARICQPNSPPSEASEIPLSIISRDEYMLVSSKSSEGQPTQIYYDPLTSAGRLYIWPTTDAVNRRIKMTNRIPVDDFDANSDDADYPQEWMDALIWNLAYKIAPEFGISGQKLNDLRFEAKDSKDNASAFDVEHASIFIGSE